EERSEAEGIDLARYTQTSTRLCFPARDLAAAVEVLPHLRQLVANFLDDTPGFRVADQAAVYLQQLRAVRAAIMTEKPSVAIDAELRRLPRPGSMVEVGDEGAE